MNAQNKLEDDRFGLCPVCHKTDGYTNAGRSHIFFCREHKRMWSVGSNLFSSWRDETEEEQRKIWDEIGLEEFADVKPYFHSHDPRGGMMDKFEALLKLPPPPKGTLARSMIYFWVHNSERGGDFFDLINRDFPDETYRWHVSPEQHRAAARESSRLPEAMQPTLIIAP